MIIIIYPKICTILINHYLQVPEQQKVANDFAISKNSLTLVVQFKSSKKLNDMAKIIIKNEKITAFGRIIFVLDKYDTLCMTRREK